MGKSTYSYKVLELVAKEVGVYFSGTEIVKILMDFGMSREDIQYPNTKWWTINEAFKYLRENEKTPDESISKLIATFLHPLNHGLDKENINKLVDKIGQYLEYDNFFIKNTGKEYAVLKQKIKEVQDERLPDINQSSYSKRVIELVAKEFSRTLTNWDIREIIKPIIQKNNILYKEENIKGYINDWQNENSFYNLGNVLETIRNKDLNADKTLSEIIATLLHPLNYSADEEKVEELAEKIRKYLKYDNVVVHNLETEYRVMSQKEIEEITTPDPTLMDFVEKGEAEYKQKIKEAKDIVIEMRDNHQRYMDILELFCEDSKKPTKQLNDAYLYLMKKMEETIDKLNLNYFNVELFRPFENDLYTAEIEWNGSGAMPELKLGPKLSWDAIRPSLYQAHSKIIEICRIAEEDTEMSDDEKKLEEITKLISEKRTQKAKIKKEPQKIVRFEISKMPDLTVRNGNENILVKNKKKIGLPKFSSTDWSKIEIRFIDENTVYIKADKKTTTVDYAGLGFSNDKKDKPNTAWYFLLELAKNKGETPVIKSPVPDRIKQHKRTISDRLKTIFKNDTDPFHDFLETNTYRTKFSLIPPSENVGTDKLGVSEYLNETMTSEYE